MHHWAVLNQLYLALLMTWYECPVRLYLYVMNESTCVNNPTTPEKHLIDRIRNVL